MIGIKINKYIDTCYTLPLKFRQLSASVHFEVQQPVPIWLMFDLRHKHALSELRTFFGACFSAGETRAEKGGLLSQAAPLWTSCNKPTAICLVKNVHRPTFSKKIC